MIWSNNDLEQKKFTRVKICQKKRRRTDGIILSSETTIHCDDDIEEVKLWQRFRLVPDWKINQRLHQPSLFTFLTLAPLIRRWLLSHVRCILGLVTVIMSSLSVLSQGRGESARTGARWWHVPIIKSSTKDCRLRWNDVLGSEYAWKVNRKMRFAFFMSSCQN